ncbi:MAG: Penicillin-binding protein 2 [candidate division WS6 bacterium 36_33]|uniref:Penicillin-binding protein 2 n=1 Tax=candidate division WS6 bacterium 36_33 TaxID=1641388 RepID=A0A101GZ84_9BACT|nr:MAG: Penicillin-binding protein 2 [candidate division WS6 bacterium 36_33]
MNLKISKDLQNGNPKRKRLFVKGSSTNINGVAKNIKKTLLEPSKENGDVRWNYLLVFLLFLFLLGVLIFELSSLQIVEGEEMLVRSVNNQVRIRKVPPYRGVIFDRNGKQLAVNESAMNVYLAIEHYLDQEGLIDTTLVEETSNTLGGILGSNWEHSTDEGDKQFKTISEKIYSIHSESPYFSEILIARDIDNDVAIKIKAMSEELPGVYIDSGSKRFYPEREVLSHVLGYTGTVSSEDISELDYVSPTDVIGRTGLEREYDEDLLGQAGEIAWEVDAVGRTISKEGYVIKEPVSGKNLYLTIDLDIQKQLYDLIREGVKEYDAQGGAAVIQDPQTGEIIAIVSYPSYDNNLFVGGISSSEYSKLITNPSNPLLNRAIAAQVPPGSTFKTLVAIAGLDSGAITKDTVYVSRRGYTFSSGAPFQDYRNSAYGALNLIDAISVSSNIYFCELIRNWDMDKLVPYLEDFGIGSYTGIDIPGEAPGRLPSPENKIALANTTNPWLDAVWYPEGDSCNSVIGQGITLVTPLQMANWTSAIANEGTLHTPHVGDYFLNEDGERKTLEYEPIRTEVASKDAIKTVKEGMWSAVNGPRATIRTLSGLGVEVAAKTGTAEFGALSKDGTYESTHAWATSFFPYDKPKYVMTIFLEDGGESINAVRIARQMVEWMIKEDLI